MCSSLQLDKIFDHLLSDLARKIVEALPTDIISFFLGRKNNPSEFHLSGSLWRIFSARQQEKLTISERT